MKIPLFRKSQMDKIESVIASLTKRDDQLAAKRITAQKALDKAIKARQEALLSGDLDDQRALDKLQGMVDSATSALSGIDDALAMLAQQKAEADSQLVDERDRAERVKVSEEINAAVSDIEQRVEPMLSEMRELGNALTAIDHLSFEVGQLGQYLSGVSGEAEVALAFVVPDVRRLADAVKNGTGAIPRRPKAVEPVPAPEPVAPTMFLGVHIADPALREANFTVIDRGPARKLEIAP
jgi:chromosome segregation ATPase